MKNLFFKTLLLALLVLVVTNSAKAQGCDPFPCGPLLLTGEITYGSSDGCTQMDWWVKLHVTNGTAPYIYAIRLAGQNQYQSYTTSDTTHTFTNLSPGTYYAWVTDANGWILTGTCENLEPLYIMGTSSQSLCGSNQACVDAVMGGIPPYSYQWSNGAGNVSCIYNVPTGTYGVTVFDAMGCFKTASIYVEEKVPPVITMLNIWDATCLLPNGSAVTMATGVGPLTYEWNGPNGFHSNNQNISGLLSGWYTLQVTDGNGCTASEHKEVKNQGVPKFTHLTSTTCDPASVGTFVQNLQTWQGCDSTITTTVTLLPSDTTLIQATTCDSSQAGTFVQHLTNQFGCDSLVETMVTLLPSNQVYLNSTTCDPTEVGVFVQNLTNQYGCDSTVTITVTLLPSTTDTMAYTICNGDYFWFFGFWYSSGFYSHTFTAVNGCDSVVVLHLTVLPPPTTNNIFETTCDPAQAGIFTDIILGSIFCDSIITVRHVVLQTIPPTFLTATTCDPSQTGTTSVMFTTAEGCDSLVITTVTLSLSTATTLQTFTCDTSAVGIFTQMFQTWQGCDSLVTTVVSLSAPLPPTFVQGETCDASQVGTTSQVFSTVNGCDSLVITTMILASPIPPTFITLETCDPAQTGTVSTTYTTPEGCDSTVITTTLLASPIPPTFLTATTCDPAQVGTTSQMLTTLEGCDSLVVTTVTLSVVTFSASVDTVTCDGGDGSISLFGLDLFYFWSTGETSSSLTGLEPGLYSVTVENGDGCEVEESFELLSPDCLPPTPPDTCRVLITVFGTDFVRVEIDNSLEGRDLEKIKATLYNESGKKVREEKYQPNSLYYSFEFPLVGLETGLYVLDAEVEIQGHRKPFFFREIGGEVAVSRKIIIP